MSLFPAYAAKADTRESSSSPELNIVNDNASTSWLTNSSFRPDIIPAVRTVLISSDSSDCELLNTVESKEENQPIITLDLDVEKTSSKTSRAKKQKRTTQQVDKLKIKVKYETIVENIYFEDKIRDRGNFKVDTLCSRARPLYNRVEKTLGFVQFKSKKTKGSIKRYFAIKNREKPKKHDTKIQKGKSKDHKKENENLEILGDLDNQKAAKEEEIKSRIQEFNKKLADNPNDIELWLEYVNFDDRDNEFVILHNDRDSETIKFQRKLAIVEKALEKNPNSSDLLKAKLCFMGELVPADQYSTQIENMLNKEPGKIILWQALIAATRSSVAMCTVPRISNLYSKCFGTLHTWPRVSVKNYDDRLLEMLYQSFIFLRHAGHWEQMWETLRLNLYLNLSTEKDSRYFKTSIDEKKLIDMEEVILSSQLPLNQLWLRVELLRENCHWISVSKNQLELIGDSHRFITPEEVSEFVHPMLSRSSDIRMAFYALMTLKIPLLPSRHCAMKDLKLKEFNWGIDSLESILPMVFPSVGEMAGHNQRISIAKGLLEGGLTSGPQYLCYHPAQEPFLDFIRDAFHSIARSLSVDNQACIYIWWLRFERMLVFLQKDTVTKSDKGFKKLKGILKDFLKQKENRNNLYYYKEYALIEREMGKLENSLNILETAIEAKGNCPWNLISSEKAALLSLYRTLIEILLDIRTINETTKSRILKVFARMTNGSSEEESLLSTREFLSQCYEDFINDSETLMDEPSSSDIFLPDFNCDVITCYCYFLYVNDHNIEEISQVYEKSLERTIENPHLQEKFYESQISLFQLICERSEAKKNWLGKYLQSALEKYPDNFYLLSVFASIESEVPYWSVGIQSENNRLFSAVALILAGRARLDSEVCRNDPTSKTAALNKLLHLHKRLTRIPEVRCCPLVWRLYMLLLREHNLCEKKGEEVYHESVASCPWARCIYIDAAEIAPQHLTQIQDVIREKDLRMHVTPEELDILRG